MNLDNIQSIPPKELELDYANPRISEFGITETTSQEEITQILWDEMGVNELIHSIVANNFWDYEPLVVIKNDRGKYTVIEGNRRLAAVMIIKNHKLIDSDLPDEITDNIDKEVKDSIETLPCLVVTERKQSWKFVGFKHVNGAAKWGSYAKAQYIAEIRNEYKIPLGKIANQIGDTHNTVRKLYQGLMVLKQAEKEKVFSRDNIDAERLYFSHLYTGLQRKGIQKFLELKDPKEEDPDPVPKENLKKLGELLEWLYGNELDNKKSVIKSQNPYLKYLDEVLQDSEALSALRSGESLDYAYDISRSDSALFQENLTQAKRSLQKARMYLLSGYDGTDELFDVARDVLDLADAIYFDMDDKRKPKRRNKRKERRSD